MNFVAGKSLQQFNAAIVPSNNFRTRTIVGKQVISAIAKTLGTLLEAGLVHRDLHDENIMIQEEGDTLNASLIDLDTLDTAEGENIDLDNYYGNDLTLSPEAGGHGVSKTSDVFGLGMLALKDYLREEAQDIVGIGTQKEMAQGPMARFGTRGTRDIEIQSKLRRLIEIYPEELQQQVHGLIEFVIAALKPRPSDRPQNAAEMQQLLSSLPNIRQI